MRGRGSRPVLGVVALTIVLVAAGLGGTPASSTTAVPRLATDGPMGHHGHWITDPEGRVVLLHGVNLVAKGVETPAQRGFDDDDAAWLADNGFDVVRLGLVAADVMPTPGVLDTAYLDSFETTVHQLTARGLLVLIDLHQDGWGPSLGSDGFPEWMTLTHGAINTHTDFPLYYVTNPAIQAAFDSFWANEAGPGGVPLQDRVGTIFGALASRFAADPNVLGYDLLNEPWPGSTYTDCLTLAGGCPTLDHDRLDPYYERMATAIRAQDPDHLLFAEPWVLFNFGQGQTNIGLPGGDANSGMSFHVYPTDPAKEPAVLDFAAAWSASTGGALLDTEFGATQDVTTIDRLVDETDGALVPWIWWSYDEQIVPDLHAPPGGANLRVPVADALIRPHPVAVAGTPTSFVYDDVARTMTFAYSTTPVAGSPLGDTTTVVEIPDRPYPGGWVATVVGGSVTSAPGVQPLTVVADPGATSVTVTVAPAGGPASTTTTATATSTNPATTNGVTVVTALPRFTG